MWQTSKKQANPSYVCYVGGAKSRAARLQFTSIAILVVYPFPGQLIY